MTTSESVKRLYKSRTDRMIDGVCGGMAAYFNLDSTLVRIAWVLLALLGGTGILLYIVAMIVMPSEPTGSSAAKTPPTTANQKFWGILLVTIGVVLLMGNLGWSIWRHWWGFSWDVMLALVLILAGVAFLFGGRNSIATPDEEPGAEKRPDRSAEGGTPQMRRLFRSKGERKILGVCGGLGKYFDIDPTIIRILFVVSAVASFGITILAYFLMGLITPEEPVAQNAS